MNKKIENLEIYIKLGFIFISILSMSSLIYNKVEIFYKVLTLGTILITFVVFFKNYKKNIFDKPFILLIFGLFATQTITALVNRSGNFFGNIIEIAFMFAYCLIMAIFDDNTKEKIFKITAYMVQFFSFVLAMFTIILLLFRTSFVWAISKEINYFYGVFGGRIWGFINPNAAAIFSYISIFTALSLINRYRDKNFFVLKLNIILQIIYFSLQQSRGAILSLIFTIILYCAFVTRETKIYRRIIKGFVYCALLFTIIFSVNAITILYNNTFKSEIIFLDKNFNTIPKENKMIAESELLKDENLKGRITDSTPSGRTYIWKNAINMAKEKPIFGYGIRNVPENYERFFNKYSISNSLKGGNFHNIFITVLVSGGILNLISFSAIILYLSYRFLKYLRKGTNSYTKIFILIFFTMMFGQLFESTIIYSTNFINIFFWFICGYGLSLCNDEKNMDNKKNEITSLDELKSLEVEILDYIVEICNKLNLKYWLAYGTLIGAIRHKGFIPWDDDIDICMLREDYEKLQDYLIQNPDKKFELMSYKNNKNYVYPFMKVINNETYLLESDILTDSKMGIYVDIFPIDGHNDDESIRNKMTKLIKKRQLSCYTFYGIYNENSIISTIIRNLCVIVFSLTNTRKYVEKIDKLAMSRKVENSEFADYVICKDMKKPVMKKEWFDKTMNHEFCGKMYKVPVEYDKILRTDYGDYMQLPPLDKQVTHHSFKVWKK